MFQDGMTICMKYHKPDLFITFITNPKWNEITQNLEKSMPSRQTEYCCQNFPTKTRAMIDITNEGTLFCSQFDYDFESLQPNDHLVSVHLQLFCKVAAYICVVEFQKRGSPLAHILIIICEKSRRLLQTDIAMFVLAGILKVVIDASSCGEPSNINYD